MPSFQWPVDKLTLINRALAVTGNNLVNVADDGSDEWNVCSPAYEDGLAVLCEEANWGFLTVTAVLTPDPTPPANTQWDTRCRLPADLIHIVWVRINQDTSEPSPHLMAQPTLYDIEDGFLVLNARGGPPPPDPSQLPGEITMKYASMNNADPVNGTPLFVRALTAYVMSGLYRGLHGDTDNADKAFATAQAIAQRARTRYDQQKPKRQLWNSRVSAARRIRHPFPQIGNNNWGGTGSAG